MRYRIVKRSGSLFWKVEASLWWLPFWSVMECFDTAEDAEKAMTYYLQKDKW